jgi:LCP family protein required for cell wall assembly
MSERLQLSPRARKLLLSGALLLVALALALAAGVLAFRTARAWTRTSLGLPASDNPQFASQLSTSLPGAPAATAPPRLPAPDVEPSLQPWDGASRVTILLMGLDYRDWEAGSDYSRSDTMILLTLDPLSKTAGILSIPRDLWVSIPGFKHGKINTAYYLGDAYKLPGGGPGLAVKTVEQFLGVPINYYAQIDFGAFVRFIDEIGGVKIDVPEAITVDLLGAGASTKKTLQPGVQVLPGEWALAYARARYTDGGDFDRARRQQQVIMAIRQRILSLDMLPVLTEKTDVLYAELASGIHTNLTLEEALRLALLAAQVPEASITRGVINEKMVIFGRSPDDLAILIPLTDKIHVLRDEIFTASAALAPMTPGNAQERMVAEGASLAVFNASRVDGLDARTATYLTSLGARAAASGATQPAAGQTRIIDHRGRPFTLRYLVDLLGISEQRIQYQYDPNSAVDVELILGNDWAASKSLP